MPKTLPKQSDGTSALLPNSVLTGMGLTAQAAPNATSIDVASGTYVVQGVEYTHGGSTKIIGAGHATNPRFDAIVATSTAVNVSAGTAAASPSFPTILSTEVLLGYVYVPAGHTSAGATLNPWDPGINPTLFLDLGDTPSTYNSSAGFFLRVNASASSPGVIFQDMSSTTVADLLGFNNAASGLAAVTIQDAIDELVTTTGDLDYIPLAGTSGANRVTGEVGFNNLIELSFGEDTATGADIKSDFGTLDAGVPRGLVIDLSNSGNLTIERVASTASMVVKRVSMRTGTTAYATDADGGHIRFYNADTDLPTVVANAFALCSADSAGAGTAAPYIINENGTVIRLFQQAAISIAAYATVDRTSDALTSVQLTDATTGGAPDNTVDPVAVITNYTAHAAGAVAVTSNAATDLDTTAAALATLENEVTAARTVINGNFRELTEELNAVRADLINVKEVLNAVITDLKATGLGA